MGAVALAEAAAAGAELERGGVGGSSRELARRKLGFGGDGPESGQDFMGFGDIDGLIHGSWVAAAPVMGWVLEKEKRAARVEGDRVRGVGLGDT